MGTGRFWERLAVLVPARSRTVMAHLINELLCSGPIFVAGPLAHGDRTAWLGM
jgi:hypothetical protein